ncbi:MAG: hypothetical protein ACI8RY_002061 [Urechidicola sp.]|jgi:hypothetical protein|tara:strand:+ start:14601 stop:15029 length:429 start_codon:yes stop_codon:yes gene_type:complete
MKLIASLLFVILSITGISQDTIKQVDTAEKVILINPLPVSIYNELKTNGSGVEVTMYHTSKTFSLPNLGGTNYFLTFLQGKSTVNFNKQNTAYVMILVKDDFYMDAEISITNESSYIIFKKDGVKYYNLLNQAGITFFRKFM